MTGLSTLPSTRDQARHALLLLGVPTSPRLLVEVHTALFDGDLSVRSLAALIRDEERAFLRSPAVNGAGPDLTAYAPGPGPGPGPQPSGGVVPPTRDVICPGLNLDLTPARGMVTLSSWPLAQRICTPATARLETLAAVIRTAEFIAARPSAIAPHLLRHLATLVPGGPEAMDVLNPAALAEAARTAIATDPLTTEAAAEAPARAEATERATHRPPQHQLFGIPTVPHQRGGA